MLKTRPLMLNRAAARSPLSRASLLRPSFLSTLLLAPLLAGCDLLGLEWAEFDVRESVEQLHVTHAEPGMQLAVSVGLGPAVAEGEVDELGSLIFRELPPGPNYFILEVGEPPRQISGPHKVMSVENSLPPPEFYSSQTLLPGFNYITTRDGTELSAYVYLPGPPEAGPYPTLVGYSGYAPSKPAEPLDLPPELEGLVSFLCATSLPVLCEAPNHPVGVIGGLFGYATVGVNVRGTGCSGGAFDYWETLQVLDGYDAIEVIAAQDWVKHNKVGMGGLSYPGISQLFVARSRPPSLASIAPLSVIAESTSSTLAPGGIFNNGFAFEWTDQVVSNALPYGQGWVQKQVDREALVGSETCAENQLLHGQLVDAIQKALDNPYYVPEIADPINPSSFVDQINVPVFLSGAWQDEQTGAHFATMLDRFEQAPVKRFTVFNGLHPDGFAPQVLAEWKAFFDIYVAREVPRVGFLLRLLSGLLFDEVFGVPLKLPPAPFGDSATLAEAQARFEAQPELRVIFESGAADELYPDTLGAPVGTFDVWSASWPPPETVPRRLYFNADGSLRSTPPEEEESSSVFLHDPQSGGRTFGGDQPFYEWAETPPGSAVVFLSDPLDEDTVMLGSGSVDLWLRSSELDADLEVILSEVRADGQDLYVQAGWLRASHRKLADDATPLRPVKTHLEADVADLDPNAWSLSRVEIFPFGHIFRAGSRIRIQVDTPGDSRERWRFMLQEYQAEEVKHYISHSAEHPSSLLLPIFSGVEVPTEEPPCPALRGQPCRDYVAYVNTLETPQGGSPAPVVPVAETWDYEAWKARRASLRAEGADRRSRLFRRRSLR